MSDRPFIVLDPDGWLYEKLLEQYAEDERQLHDTIELALQSWDPDRVTDIVTLRYERHGTIVYRRKVRSYPATMPAHIRNRGVVARHLTLEDAM